MSRYLNPLATLFDTSESIEKNKTAIDDAYRIGKRDSEAFEQDTSEKYYNVEESFRHAREKILHEDDLVNQRLTWFITLTGLLYSAVGFTYIAQGGALRSVALIESPAEEIVSNFNLSIGLIRLSLFSVGVGSAIASFIGIVAAFRRISRERVNFYIYLSYMRGVIGKNFVRRESVSWMPRLTGHTSTNMLGMSCGLLLPIIVGLSWFIFGWSFVLIFKNSVAMIILLFLQAAVLYAVVIGISASLDSLRKYQEADSKIKELHDLYDKRDLWDRIRKTTQS